MASIKVDINSVRSKQSNITATRDHIFKAIYETACMSVPSNLYGEEAYFLNHLREKLDGIVSSLNSYDAWIDSSLYQVSDTFNNINRDIAYLEGFKLEERDNSVLVK